MNRHVSVAGDAHIQDPWRWPDAAQRFERQAQVGVRIEGQHVNSDVTLVKLAWLCRRTRCAVGCRSEVTAVLVRVN